MLKAVRIVKMKKTDFGTSSDVRISFEVRSVQINRPWVDLSALELQNWKIPGLATGSWSTGVLDSSNKGLFAILPTEMIVVRNVTVAATKFSEEIVDTLSTFNKSAETGVLVSEV